MSNFTCEKCGMSIIDSDDGYITGCPHYPNITDGLMPLDDDIDEWDGGLIEIVKKVMD